MRKTETNERVGFDFGKNWERFLRILDETRILEAERSLKEMLEVERLVGKRFLDVGSGSGLFSLAARRLGAEVHSFDYDPLSVACTEELKRRYFPNDTRWTIGQGSVLDTTYLNSLGKYDIVYSWGVLHHTGNMWEAMGDVALLVKTNGKFYISIYNDQGLFSQVWTSIKRFYNHSPTPMRLCLVLFIGVIFEIRAALVQILQFKNPLPFKRWADKKKSRGMSVWYDLVDWVGGYPFQVAKPEEVFEFYRKRGFVLTRLKTCRGGLGCNEYVFVRCGDAENRVEGQN